MTHGIMDITHPVIGIRGIIGVHGIHGIMVQVGAIVHIRDICRYILPDLPILIMVQETVMEEEAQQLP